jgi:hypothetical protein
VKRLVRLLLVAAVVVVLAPIVARSLAAADAKPMPMSMVTIFHIAPGKHVEFLKSVAASEAWAKEAGVPATQFYAHAEGDSWDYLTIGPILTDAQQQKLDAVTKAHGGKVGWAANFEFRTFAASHTDTRAAGPTSATELLAAAGM